MSNAVKVSLVALMSALVLGLPAMAESSSAQKPLTGSIQANTAVDDSGFSAPTSMTAKQLKAMEKKEKRERRAAQRQMAKEKQAGSLVSTDMTAYAAQRANEAAQRSFMNASTLMLGRF